MVQLPNCVFRPLLIGIVGMLRNSQQAKGTTRLQQQLPPSKPTVIPMESHQQPQQYHHVQQPLAQRKLSNRLFAIPSPADTSPLPSPKQHSIASASLDHDTAMEALVIHK